MKRLTPLHHASVSKRFSLRGTIYLLVLLLLTATGCSENPVGPEDGSTTISNAPAPPPPSAPAPEITMSSVNATLTDGSEGLQFFARANQDVFYRKVTITPPPPFDAITYNLDNTFVIKEQSIALQQTNTAYRKLGGRWTFAYDVTTGTGASATDHTVTVSFEVAGKNDATPDASAGLVIKGQ